MSSIFVQDGDFFNPTSAAGGPWSPDMLQGSATIALMAREADAIASRAQLAIRRLTFDLIRPAQKKSMRLEFRATHESRKTARFVISLLDDRTEIAQCSALLVRETEAPPSQLVDTSDPHPDAGVPPPSFAQNWSEYFQHVSTRLIEGALERPGPAAAWLRLDVPLIADKQNSPLIQAVQAADFASGISQTVDMRDWSFINPEITIHFSRPPSGSWILVRAATTVGPGGAGLVKATLCDLQGAFAEVAQSTIFERRRRTN